MPCGTVGTALLPAALDAEGFSGTASGLLELSDIALNLPEA